MPHKAVFAGFAALLCATPVQAFHNSELDPETKQSLSRAMDAFSALGDSLANAQRACARGDQGACQYEQQGKALVRQIEQGMSAGMASRPGGMPPAQGNFGMGTQPFPGASPGASPGGPPQGWSGGSTGGGYGAPPAGPFGNSFGGGQNMPPTMPPTMPPGGYGNGMGGGPQPGMGAMPPWGQGGRPMQGPNR